METRTVRRQRTKEHETNTTEWLWATSLGRQKTPTNVIVLIGHGRWDLDKLFERALQPYLDNDGLAVQTEADKDVDISDRNPGAGYGNGGGNMIYRLREGIERFTISDINNPAATSQAQSDIFIMLDLLGNTAAVQYFNHVPGGCNVLFMDGHVAFIRYINNEQAATPPVMPSLATMVGVLAAAE